MVDSSILCCPACKGELVSTLEATAAGAAEASQSYVCSGCGATYPVQTGIVDFLPTANRLPTRSDRVMQSEWVVNIYESKWWRGSLFPLLLFGISQRDEMALIDRIAAAAPGDTILDLACGPGFYTRHFAAGSPDRRVVGLDISWPMLRYAHKKSRQFGLTNVRFVHGDAHSLPIKDGSLDIVICTGAFHLFPDRPRVMAELRRVLKPGGRFALAVALLNPPRLLRWLKPFLDSYSRRRWAVHQFDQETLRRVLDEGGFEPTIYYARRIWMIAGGVRRP